MTAPIHPAITSNALAVITGGASGIGLAAAKALAARSMSVAIADVAPTDQLQRAVEQVQSHAKAGGGAAKVWAANVDVGKRESVEAFRAQVKREFPDTPLRVLMANAGTGGKTSASTWDDNWDRILNTNLFGVINTVQTFLPDIKAHGQPALVINTGSKQGITNVPATGTSYALSKADEYSPPGVKIFTEQLAHEMRSDAKTSVIEPKLLIPGWVHTGLTGAREKPQKPEGAWSAEQTVDYLFERVAKGSFYVLCPDNETPREQDLKRMQWNLDDIREDRPALSRWHPEWSDKFSAYAKS